MNKNVWILNHYAKTPDMAGGTRHFDLSQELVKKGYKVTIFTSGFEHSSKRYIKIKPKDKFRVENINDVRFVWLNTIPYYGNNWRRIINMISYGVRALRVAKKFEKPNVIIGSSVHPFAVVAAWWLAKRYKVRFIFEVRDLWPQTAVEMGVIKSKGIPARILYAWEKFMYKKANKIIVLLPDAKKYIESKGISAEKIVWIPNGVNLEQFNNPKQLGPDSNLAQLLRKNKNKFKVIYTGAHGPANGLNVVVKAASILQKNHNEVQFFLIGNGVEKEKLQYNAEKYNLKNIHFFSSIPKEQIPGLLQYADLLLHCLAPVNVFKYGISPNKVFDYLVSGKPVIMSVKTSNNIVQEAGVGITVEPGNAEAFAKGIVKIQEMAPEERQKLGANGRVYVEKYHSSKILVEKLEKIL